MNRASINAVSKCRISTRVSLSKTDESGVRVLKLTAPPVNTLTWEGLDELNAAMSEANLDDSCKAVVITSEKPGVFSAGLNLQELHKPDETRLRNYWKKMQELYRHVHGSPKYVVAGINGAAPAGGCFLALLCDYRILADTPKCVIGLNETQLGMAPPIWFYGLYERVFDSPAKAERHMAQGTLFAPADAVAHGVVDEIVPIEDVTEAAIKHAQAASKVPHKAVSRVRLMVRAEKLSWLNTNAEKDADEFQAQVCSDTMQRSLDAYMASFNARKKK
jgi:Delta3-Delta2-enoyl-CoA isomerase